MSMARNRVNKGTVPKWAQGVSNKPKVIKAKVQVATLQGKNISETAEELGLAPQTVRRIMHELGLDEMIEQARRTWFEKTIGYAMEAEIYTLKVKKDGHLGHKVLVDSGVIPAKDSKTQTPALDVSAKVVDENSGQKRQIEMLANLLQEGHDNFGISLDEDALKKMMVTLETKMDEKKTKPSGGG